MFSYIAFYNDTKYPYISVCEGDDVIAECLPRHEKSKYCLADAGSISVTLFDNHKKPFLDLYISLKPNKFHVVKIREFSAEFM